MGIAEQQVDIAPEELQALQAAFAQFSRRTEELRSAYANLQREAEGVNVQLEEANRALEQKVREQDELYHFQHPGEQSDGGRRHRSGGEHQGVQSRGGGHVGAQPGRGPRHGFPRRDGRP